MDKQGSQSIKGFHLHPLEGIFPCTVKSVAVTLPDATRTVASWRITLACEAGNGARWDAWADIPLQPPYHKLRALLDACDPERASVNCSPACRCGRSYAAAC